METFDELDRLQNNWAQASQEAVAKTANRETLYNPLPDGEYTCVIEDYQLKRSKTSERPMLEMTLRVETSKKEGDKYRGRREWHRRVIGNETLTYVAEDLTICGIDPTGFRLQQLAAYLPAAHGLSVEIRVVTKNDNRNIYLNRRVGDEEVGLAQHSVVEELPGGKEFAQATN
jgi:hypothetical protein